MAGRIYGQIGQIQRKLSSLLVGCKLKHAALSTAAQRMPPSLSMPMENIDSQGKQLQEMDSEKSFKVG